MKLNTNELKALLWLAENKSEINSVHDITPIRDAGDVGWLVVAVTLASRSGRRPIAGHHYIVSPLGNVYESKWNNARRQYERDMDKETVLSREALGIAV